MRKRNNIHTYVYSPLRYIDIKKSKIQTDRQTDRHINVQDRKINMSYLYHAVCLTILYSCYQNFLMNKDVYKLIT